MENEIAHFPRKQSINQQGMTLIELMIALTIGLVIFAGVLSIFVGMRTTTEETSSYGELQENGRFAISVLTDDLQRQNFWGDYIGPFSLGPISIDADIDTATEPSNECTGAGGNNGTFPNGNDAFRTLWGQTVTTANPMGCFTDAETTNGSDLIQIKRVVSSPIREAGAVVPTPIGSTTTDNFFLMSSSLGGVIFDQGVNPGVNNGQVWQYQHHVYYVRNETQGANNVPVLMQGQLTTRMSFAPIIDGIEMIRFMYGVDLDTNPSQPGYGSVDTYLSADSMTDALWDNASGMRILAVKVYVLARSIRPDNDYVNRNTYQLGDLLVGAKNDNYRRLLFSSTVTLYNAAVDTF